MATAGAREWPRRRSEERRMRLWSSCWPMRSGYREPGSPSSAGRPHAGRSSRSKGSTWGRSNDASPGDVAQISLADQTRRCKRRASGANATAKRLFAAVARARHRGTRFGSSWHPASTREEPRWRSSADAGSPRDHRASTGWTGPRSNAAAGRVTVWPERRTTSRPRSRTSTSGRRSSPVSTARSSS